MSTTTSPDDIVPGQQVRFEGPSGTPRQGTVLDTEWTPTIDAHHRYRLRVDVGGVELAIVTDDLL